MGCTRCASTCSPSSAGRACGTGPTRRRRSGSSRALRLRLSGHAFSDRLTFFFDLEFNAGCAGRFESDADTVSEGCAVPPRSRAPRGVRPGGEDAPHRADDGAQALGGRGLAGEYFTRAAGVATKLYLEDLRGGRRRCGTRGRRTWRRSKRNRRRRRGYTARRSARVRCASPGPVASGGARSPSASPTWADGVLVADDALDETADPGRSIARSGSRGPRQADARRALLRPTAAYKRTYDAAEDRGDACPTTTRSTARVAPRYSRFVIPPRAWNVLPRAPRAAYADRRGGKDRARRARLRGDEDGAEQRERPHACRCAGPRVFEADLLAGRSRPAWRPPPRAEALAGVLDDADAAKGPFEGTGAR